MARRNEIDRHYKAEAESDGIRVLRREKATKKKKKKKRGERKFDNSKCSN